MSSSCTAFAGSERIASGEPARVALAVKERMEAGEPAPLLIFDDLTSELVDFDWRDSAEEIVARLTPSAAPSPETQPVVRGPGRPKLGVVAREVTLLPRHWEWLNGQPGGASVALRKLVEEARKANAERDRIRAAQESAYRFLSAMAGNEPFFEEAVRALFAGERERFAELTRVWPEGVREHGRKLAAAAC